MDIFISYSRKDRGRVTHMAKALEDEGYTVWWDRHIKPGQDFHNVIQDAIENATTVVVVWSMHSIRSNWVKDEAQFGIQNDKLVPVMIDEVNTPLGFGSFHAAELFDGGDNPAESENWPDFVENIERLATESAQNETEDSGAGAAGGADLEGVVRNPPKQTAQRAAGGGARRPPRRANAPLWKRYLPMAGAAAGLVVAALLVVQYFGSSLGMGPKPPEDMTPVVLGIYPNEGFGNDQRLGLTSAFSDSDIDVIHLTATLNAMKGRNAPELIDALKANLEKRNVIAIIGPSITELTPQVLEVVEESGRDPAIILTTAAPRQVIGWDDSDLPLFRVGSGVDERAKQFALLARNTIASGTELVLLYESVPNTTSKTYGEVFFNQIKANIPEWNQWLREDKAHDISYLRGEIMSSLSRDELLQHFDEDKMIIVVGLSSDYAALVVNLYRSDLPERPSLLGGWNTGKAMRDLGQEMGIQNTRLFDMTDVYSSPAAVRNLVDSKRFVKDFGELDAGKRQEAVAFDSGLVIKQAATMVEGEITAEEIVKILRGQSFAGVTGEITFADNGQNEGEAGGRSLHNLWYDPSSDAWVQIERFDDLMIREIAQAQQ